MHARSLKSIKSKWKWPSQVIVMLLAAAIVSQPAWPAPANAPANANADGAGSDSSSSADSAAKQPSAADFQHLEQLLEQQSAQLQQLTQELRDQQTKTAALEAKLNANAAQSEPAVVPASFTSPVNAISAAASPADAIPVAANPQSVAQPRPNGAQGPVDLSTRIANLEQRATSFGPFSLNGDIRLREEPFFGGPTNRSLDQNRARVRVRFNVTAKLNSDFSGGFSLASGDINDPTTTNQTLTQFYARKAIALDKFFVTYTPSYFHPLSVVVGKFAYPWFNTELTWDKDLNPEGAAETLAFDLKSTPVLKRVALVGFQLPFAQVSGVSATDQSLKSAVVYGGQLQTVWQLVPRVKFGAYSGFYNWHNADPVALALAKASAKNPQTPFTGALPLGAGNGSQNSIVTTTSTNGVTVAGVFNPTGITTITNAQFASKFALFDSLARIDIDTGSAKWPVTFIGDYVQNMEACANVPNIAPAPANTTSLHFTQATSAACNSRQRRGYWGEAQVGRGSKKHDVQFDYARIFIEREAVLSNFNYSDIRQGSNVTQHRVMGIYQLENNIQLSATALIGRPLNFGSAAPPQPWLERYQFDLIYTF